VIPAQINSLAEARAAAPDAAGALYFDRDGDPVFCRGKVWRIFPRGTADIWGNSGLVCFPWRLVAEGLPVDSDPDPSDAIRRCLDAPGCPQPSGGLLRTVAEALGVERREGESDDALRARMIAPPPRFEVGQIVRIARKVESEPGWRNSWVAVNMDALIGKSGRITAISPTGVYLDGDARNYGWPPSALELVAVPGRAPQVGDEVAGGEVPDRAIAVRVGDPFGVALRWGEFGTWIRSPGEPGVREVGALGADITREPNWKWAELPRARWRIAAVGLSPEQARSPGEVRKLLGWTAEPSAKVGDTVSGARLPVGAIAHPVSGGECELALRRLEMLQWVTSQQGAVWDREGGTYADQSSHYRVIALGADPSAPALAALAAAVPALEAEGFALRTGDSGLSSTGYVVSRSAPKVGDEVEAAALPVGAVAAQVGGAFGDVALRRLDGLHFVAKCMDTIEPFTGSGSPVEGKRAGPEVRWRVLARGVAPDATCRDALDAAGRPVGSKSTAPAPATESDYARWRALVGKLGPHGVDAADLARDRLRRIVGDPAEDEALEAEAIALLGGGAIAVEGRPWVFVGAYAGRVMARRALDRSPDWNRALVERLRLAVGDWTASSLTAILGAPREAGRSFAWGAKIGESWWEAAASPTGWSLRRARTALCADSARDLDSALRGLLGAVLLWATEEAPPRVTVGGDLLGDFAPPDPTRPVLAHLRAVPPGCVRGGVAREGPLRPVELGALYACATRVCRLTRCARPAIVATVDLLASRIP
jgi:hypothetical protein